MNFEFYKKLKIRKNKNSVGGMFMKNLTLVEIENLPRDYLTTQEVAAVNGNIMRYVLQELWANAVPCSAYRTELSYTEKAFFDIYENGLYHPLNWLKIGILNRLQKGVRSGLLCFSKRRKSIHFFI